MRSAIYATGAITPAGPRLTYGTKTFNRRAPSNLFVASTEPTLAIISPDHLTSMEMINQQWTSGTDQCGNSGGSWQFSWNGANGNANIDLKGPGIYSGDHQGVVLNTGDEATPFNVMGVTSGNSITQGGQVSAARTSVLGGLIRPGELTNGIHHALWFATTTGILNQNGPNSQCYVWPAANCDGNHNSYGASGPLYMGGIIAIPASVNLSAHTFNTMQGKNLASALQQYGAYIVDTGGAFMGQNVDNNVTDVPDESSASGRTSYFIPFIPRSLWAWFTQGILH